MKKKDPATMLQPFVLILLLILCNGCGNNPSTNSDLSPIGTPPDFSIEKFPESMDAIPLQRCVGLVKITESDSLAKTGPVSIAATASPPCEISVNMPQISKDEVAEVTVIPRAEDVNNMITVTITGSREGIEKKESFTINVIPGVDGSLQTAQEIRDRFVKWLAINRPELNINESTEWTGTTVRYNIFIVSYYLFFSDEWEMGMTWHVMVEPYDWARIYLRPRTSSMIPVHAFEITSLGSGDDPHPIDPPPEVYR